MLTDISQRSPWDGWADDMTKPGQFKDYYYPNSQVSLLPFFWETNKLVKAEKLTLTHRALACCGITTTLLISPL